MDSVSVGSPEDLKAEIQRRISQMQSCCLCLRFSSWKVCCQILMWSVMVLMVVSVVMEKVYGPDAGAAMKGLSFMAFALLLYGLCVKLPGSRRLVTDLKCLSMEFKDATEALKQRVDKEVWFRSMSSRWSSVQELERSGTDIHGYVDTMGSVVNSFLISELQKKLKESQKHLKNI